MSTVSTMTAIPSLADRPNAAQMSTTPNPPHSRENQWVDTPFIGNVSPPEGP